VTLCFSLTIYRGTREPIVSRGRPKLTVKKSALGLARQRRTLCSAFGAKDLQERRLTTLRHIVTDIRPEDVTAEHSAAVQNLNLHPLQLPAALLHSDVNVDELQPLLSRDAWRKLKAVIRQRTRANVWTCACCKKDLGSARSVECSSCLEWYHYGCVGFKRKCKGNWYCSSCAK